MIAALSPKWRARARIARRRWAATDALLAAYDDPTTWTVERALRAVAIVEDWLGISILEPERSEQP